MKPEQKPRGATRRALLSTTTRLLVGTAAATLLPGNAPAQDKPTPARAGKGKAKGARVKFSNPPTIAAPRGYSHIAEVISGRPVYIAGQVAQDQAGNLVGKGDFRAQCVQVFENLKAALAAVGADFTHVVKLNNYLTDMTNLAAFREVRDQYVNVKTPPASTTVQVTKLAREEWLIETEAVAILPE